MKKPTRKNTTKAPAKVAAASTSIEPKASADMGIKKKAFVEEAVERSGVEKKFAKPAIESALALLSEALLDEKVSISPLWKLKVNRKKDLLDAKVLKLGLRTPDQMGAIKSNGFSDGKADRLATSKAPK